MLYVTWRIFYTSIVWFPFDVIKPSEHFRIIQYVWRYRFLLSRIYIYIYIYNIQRERYTVNADGFNEVPKQSVSGYAITFLQSYVSYLKYPVNLFGFFIRTRRIIPVVVFGVGPETYHHRVIRMYMYLRRTRLMMCSWRHYRVGLSPTYTYVGVF